ncbi:MAG TPA: beta-ketoacyl-[acyl-carrier-protein] synthase family protein [Tepidisphaeraceae bacterium]|nr:beta-ketoacyl-[acyl-carrier-protein] synthase family protein [Tepidisphaeraceae bacterium]
MRRVVVTGVGVVSPIGIGADAFWSSLTAGKVGVRSISLFDASGFPCQIAGEVPPYKIGEFVPKSYRKGTKVMARDIELAVIAADDAFKSAGLQSQAYTEKPTFDATRFGCNIGAGLISCELDELTSAMTTARGESGSNTLSLEKWGREGMQQLTPLWLLKYLPNMLACHVTIIHGLMGPSNTITCDAASSHLAIGEAFRTIQRGKADVAICGGAESRVNPMGLVRQQLLNRLNASDNGRPEQALRPFDPAARGTVFGEGGGLLILEEYEAAKSRGARIYAELVGFAASQDTHRVTEPEPTGHSYAKAIENSLKDAKLTGDDIDLIIPHGTGIAKDDRAELNGLRRALGANLSQIALSTVKPQTGLLGAGCGVDACAAVLAVAHSTLPPAINSPGVCEGTTLNVSATAREKPVRAVVSSVYSLGGQNASLVFSSLKSASTGLQTAAGE